MYLKAYAKLNLTLEILHLRDDGFHEVSGIMQTISLADELTFTPAPNLELVVTNDKNLETNDNLILKAARKLDSGQGAKITLTKNIPFGAGLGGGSSDAAISLVGLNHLWELGLDDKTLWELAQSLGSDVPFFLTGGTAQIAGRGELVTPIPSKGSFWYLLVKPPLAISTPWAYRIFDENPASPPQATEKMKAALEIGDSLLVGQALANNFEGPIFSHYPQLQKYKEALLAAGAIGAAMSGSGPTIFGLFPTKEATLAAQKELTGDEPELEVFVAHSVCQSQYLRQENACSVEKVRRKE